MCDLTPQRRNGTYGSLLVKRDNQRKYVTTLQTRRYGSLQVKWDNRRKYVTTPQKKNVWKPTSKMGQSTKVCNETMKRTYGSLIVKWDNQRKYVTTLQTRRYGSQQVKWDNRRKYATTPQKKNVWKPTSKMGQSTKVCNENVKRTYGSLKVTWEN